MASNRNIVIDTYFELLFFLQFCINHHLQFLQLFKTLRFPQVGIFCVNRGDTDYSHLSNKRGGWNKPGGGAKFAKSKNVEVEILQLVFSPFVFK